MPAVDAIYHTGTPVTTGYSVKSQTFNPYSLVTFTAYKPRSTYLAISSTTVDNLYNAVFKAEPQDYAQTDGNSNVTTQSIQAFPSTPVTVSAIKAKNTFAFLPCEVSMNNLSYTFATPLTISVKGQSFSQDIATMIPNTGSVTMGTWSISQDSYKNVIISCTSFGGNYIDKIFYSYQNNNNGDLQSIPEIWKVSLQNTNGVEIVNQMLRPSVDTLYPALTIPASNISVTTTYNVTISKRIVGDLQTQAYFYFYCSFSAVLTAPAADTGGGGGGTTAMFSWLNNDYWYLTDLQVNLGTRAVTHRHGTIQIKPNDTVQFGIFFHDGSVGKNPVATDLRLAVRSANNASAYYFWANPSVTTTSVSGDVYYMITVTASDEDLLASQAAGLVSGSGGNQNLIAEVQWTTTRGTFTSDTFTIQVPSEVIREPDV